MRNTLEDLNNYLFEQLERLNDDNLSKEDFEKERKKTDSIVKVAEKIIQNGELAFRTMQHMDEYGYGLEKNRKVPELLTLKER